MGLTKKYVKNRPLPRQKKGCLFDCKWVSKNGKNQLWIRCYFLAKTPFIGPFQNTSNFCRYKQALFVTTRIDIVTYIDWKVTVLLRLHWIAKSSSLVGPNTTSKIIANKESFHVKSVRQKIQHLFFVKSFNEQQFMMNWFVVLMNYDIAAMNSQIP